MSIGLYDKALTEKISKWVNDPNMRISGPDETRRLFLYKADTNNDGPIELPLIAIRRGRDIEVIRTNKKPTTFDGLTLLANSDLVMLLNSVPISVSYLIDIYTRLFSEADEYVRNFIFNIINYPTLNISIPYNDINLTHTSNIRMVGSVSDNSDISERLIVGLFTRFTIGIAIDDAYLWSAPIKRNLKVDVDVIE